MFKLDYNISIGGKTFKGVTDVTIKRNITSLSGTAKIKVPTTAVYKQSDGTRNNVMTSQIIKRGDKVEISLGYNGKLRKEFSGYVSRVNFARPLEVECEDAVYLLKQKSIKKTYKDTTLEAVLADIVSGLEEIVNGKAVPKEIKVNTGGLAINIDKLILATDAGTEVSRETALLHVLDIYGLVGYFDENGGLFVGLRQGNKTGSVKYRFGWNTIKDNELKYHNAEDQKLKIKAIYINKLGVRTEVEVGDDEGSARTVFLTDVADASQMTKLAQNELDKYKFTGFAGNFTAFLQPFAIPGYVIEIEDKEFQQRSGKYYCEGVEVAFGQNGARRKIEIGAQV